MEQLNEDRIFPSEKDKKNRPNDNGGLYPPPQPTPNPEPGEKELLFD